MLGSLLLLIGAGSYITHWALSPYLFTTGAVLVAVAQAFSIPRDASLTLKRLHIQQAAKRKRNESNQEFRTARKPFLKQQSQDEFEKSCGR